MLSPLHRAGASHALRRTVREACPRSNQLTSASGVNAPYAQATSMLTMVDIRGTVLKEAVITQFSKYFTRTTCHLTDLKLSGCVGLSGVRFDQLLTPAVCIQLGPTLTTLEARLSFAFSFVCVSRLCSVAHANTTTTSNTVLLLCICCCFT